MQVGVLLKKIAACSDQCMFDSMQYLIQLPFGKLAILAGVIPLLLELVKSPFWSLKQGALVAIGGLAKDDSTGYAAEAVIAAGSVVHVHDDTALHSNFNHMVHPGQTVLHCSLA